MQLILFSSVTNFEEEHVLVNYFLLDKELTFHIRKPDLTLEETRNYIAKIPKEYHCQLVIHQYLELLNEFNLKGFHCTRYFLATYPKKIIELKKDYPNCTFSKSCHSLIELKALESFSYVFLSPIFDSLSKEGYTTSFSIENVSKALKNLKIPVYALGGVSNKTLGLLKNSNFKGVAVLGYIWNTTTPQENYNELKKVLFLN